MPDDRPTPGRIKRQVIGKRHTFFAITPPGFEFICAREIAALPADVDQVKIMTGGVEFKSRLTGCYESNLRLRTSNRVLMRLIRFKATNFRQLENRAGQVPWELHLSPGVDRVFSVTCVRSRLMHTGAISERLEACIQKRVPQTCSCKATRTRAGNVRRQRIHVRIVDDRVVLSLDSSGPLLFKRGLKQDVGPAPIRETLAAAVLKISGYDGSQVLLDPMCGSGSFSLEGAMIAANIPAGFYRQFAFMNWPAFRGAHWRHLKQTAFQNIRRANGAKIMASDLDPKRIAALKKTAAQFDLSGMIQAARRDFFKIDPGQITDKPGILVLNPPYGVRLATEKNPKDFYARIRCKLLSAYRNWQIALLINDPAANRLFPKQLQRTALKHGGIDLVLIYGVIKPERT